MALVMSEPARLTVAIATFDRHEKLARCIDALLAGDVSPAEIVVVDQGEQSAAEMIRAYDNQAVPVIHISDGQRGLAASRNLAGSIARGSVLAVTDDDCVPDVGWVAAIARTLAGTNGPDAVTGRVLPLGPSQPNLRAVSSRTDSRPREFAGRSLPWLVGTGANFAVRRAWLRHVGGYDVRLGVGTAGGAGEDLDLLYRLLLAGARIRYEPDAIVYHERQSKERRTMSRGSYGRGVGACCGIWLRRGDVGALYVLIRWTGSRLRRLARGTCHRNPESIEEEVRVLIGTFHGLRYGLVVGRDQ